MPVEEKQILEAIPESLQKMVYEQLKEKFETKPAEKKLTEEEVQAILAHM